MEKSYQRSIRMSEEVREVVERQMGEGFNQKFENLVRRFAWEEKALGDRLTQKQKDLDALQKKLNEKRDLLLDLERLTSSENEIMREITRLSNSILGYRERLSGVVTQTIESAPGAAPANGLQSDEKENVTQTAARGDRTSSKNGLHADKKENVTQTAAQGDRSCSKNGLQKKQKQIA